MKWSIIIIAIAAIVVLLFYKKPVTEASVLGVDSPIVPGVETNPQLTTSAPVVVPPALVEFNRTTGAVRPRQVSATSILNVKLPIIPDKGTDRSR